MILILVHIFLFMDLKSISRCAQVKKQFYCAAVDWTLHKKLSHYYKLMNSTIMDYFLEPVIYLPKLNNKCGKEGLISLVKHGGNKLTHLELDSVGSTVAVTFKNFEWAIHFALVRLLL